MSVKCHYLFYFFFQFSSTSPSHMFSSICTTQAFLHLLNHHALNLIVCWSICFYSNSFLKRQARLLFYIWGMSYLCCDHECIERIHLFSSTVWQAKCSYKLLVSSYDTPVIKLTTRRNHCKEKTFQSLWSYSAVKSYLSFAYKTIFKPEGSTIPLISPTWSR